VRAEGDDAQHVLKNLEMANHGSSPRFNPAIRARLANRAYWLVAPRFVDLGTPAQAFVSWLRQEIRAGSAVEPARR